MLCAIYFSLLKGRHVTMLMDAVMQRFAYQLISLTS